MVQDGGRVQRTLELLLFDLDDTLVQTGDLENFRGVAHVGPQTDEYDQRLKRAFVSTTARNLYSARQLADLRQRWPALKVGIFTRAPRHYTDIVLKLAFPETTWDVVVSFEDVRRTKPDGEGVGHAMKACGIRSSSSVAIVGDGKSDVQAAYNGGCWAFLDRGSWPPKLRREDWWALERVPDAVIEDPHRLIEVLACPEAELPELERAFSSAAGSAHHRPRFDGEPDGGASRRLARGSLRANDEPVIGFWTLFYKELLRFWKVAFQTVAAPVLTALLYLMIFGHVLDDHVQVHGVRYTSFLIPGLVMMQVLQNAFANSSSSLIQAKITGSIVFVLLPPIPYGAFFAAYVASRALGAGVTYLQVFRFVGVTVFLGYSAALWHVSIWYHRAWSLTIKWTVGALIYACLMAGAFGWLWPK